MHLRAHGLAADFEREVVFHSERLWRYDFACRALKIAVEIEGGTRSGKSRHSKGQGFDEDCRKYNAAAALGWCVCRYSTEMVKSGEAIAFVVDLVRTRLCPN